MCRRRIVYSKWIWRVGRRADDSSEVVGEVAVETDKKFRTFSLRAAAEASYDGYGEEAKKVLGWYAEGVNAFIEKAEWDDKFPYEFKILGVSA